MGYILGSAYRQEVKELALWCGLINLELNAQNSGDDRVLQENPPALPHSPSWTALWLQWSHSDSWAPQFLRTWSGTLTLSPWWKRPSWGCTSFTSWGSSTCHRSCWNSSTPPSFNLSSVWFSSATKSDLRRLRRVVRTAELIIGTTLPTLQELYSSRVSKRAGQITLDPSHLTSSTLSLWTVLVDATKLRAPERPDTGTVYFLRQSSHEHLTLNMEHTTLLYNI